MSSYDGSQYLRTAVESVLSQTFSDFEFLIIDDASKDDTLALFKEYQKKDNRIQIVENKTNQGLTKNLNTLIKMSKGEYLARFDDDDVSFPQRFAAQAQYLDAHPECALVGSWAEIINENGDVIRTVKYPTEPAVLKKDLIKYNPFFHPAIMMRKDAVDAIGDYDEHFRYAQDYELYLRLSKKYAIANVGEILIQYRENKSSITTTKNKAQVGFVIEAKYKALRDGDYPWYEYRQLIRLCVIYMLPAGVKKFFRNIYRYS